MALMENRERLDRENATLKGKQRVTEVSKRLHFTPEDETPIDGVTNVLEHESDQAEIQYYRKRNVIPPNDVI